jgi:hypothetical protein
MRPKLKLNENGTRSSETVWNDSGRPSHEEEFKQYSATGGGCSTLFTAPTWQQDTPGWGVRLGSIARSVPRRA